jgi:hypothetical protein
VTVGVLIMECAYLSFHAVNEGIEVQYNWNRYVKYAEFVDDIYYR